MLDEGVSPNELKVNDLVPSTEMRKKANGWDPRYQF